MNYPSENADSLELYVLWNYSLSAPALHLYRGMRWLEREKSGLCKTVVAEYRDLAAFTRINIKTMKKKLMELQEKGLIELAIGSPITTERKATAFRRRTLDEIKTKSIQGDGDAHRLATALSGRAFDFGGKIVKPMWTVGITGRVMSSKPNIQGLKGADRLAGLKTGLSQDQVLVTADIKAAEPTLIKHLLGIPKERDLYQEYMSATACSRNDAKKAINRLSYCKNTLACFRYWPESAQAILGDYVQKLAAYKAALCTEFKTTRSTTTLTGRRIAAEKGRRIHAGHPLNWRVQGTVADIINAACLRLLESAGVVIPMHDALYVILPSEKSGAVEGSIIDKAREIGLSVELETEVHHAA